MNQWEEVLNCLQETMSGTVGREEWAISAGSVVWFAAQAIRCLVREERPTDFSSFTLTFPFSKQSH